MTPTYKLQILNHSSHFRIVISDITGGEVNNYQRRVIEAPTLKEAMESACLDIVERENQKSAKIRIPVLE